MYAEVQDTTLVTFPYEWSDWRAQNPFTTPGSNDLLAAYQGTERNLAGFALTQVVDAPPPPITQFQIRAATSPALVDGTWTRGWTVTDMTPADMRAKLKANVASLRFEKEVAGITLPDGTNIRTDRESQAALSGAYTSLKDGLIPDTDWKGANGWADAVTFAQIQPIAQAVAAHVRACFNNESAHSKAIDACADADLAAYDITTGWPA